MDEIQKIGEQLVNVRIELGQLSTKMDAIKDMSKKLDDVADLAKKATESTKMAHHRIDKLDKINAWIGTTVIGGIILAVLGFILKGGLIIK